MKGNVMKTQTVSTELPTEMVNTISTWLSKTGTNWPDMLRNMCQEMLDHIEYEQKQEAKKQRMQALFDIECPNCGCEDVPDVITVQDDATSWRCDACTKYNVKPLDSLPEKD